MDIVLEDKIKILERLVLQDIVESYGAQKVSEKSYDVLMTKLLDRMTDFYESLELDKLSLQRVNQYGDRAEIYKQQLRNDLGKAAEVTVRQIVNQLPREKLSNRSQWEVIQAVRPILQRRAEVLSNLLSASALQMQNYMLLWEYQDEGYSRYCLLTDGENCDSCNQLEGQTFSISRARVGENCPPLHPNCNCRIGILNDVGQVVYIISEGEAEENVEKANWYDAFLRLPQDAKELFLSFVRSQEERLGKGSLTGFLDWLTLGTISGSWQGYQDRWGTMLQDPTLYNVVNYLSSGLADTVKGTINPKEPLSLQHWLDMLEVVAMAYGSYQTGGKAPKIRDVTTTVQKGLGKVDDLIEHIKIFDDAQLTTEPNTAYFWSGMGENGAETAAAIAEKNKGITLEITVNRNSVNIPKWDFDNPDSIKAWQDASEAFAKQASGEVKVVLGPNVRPNSIWATKELPLLIQNQKVTKIIEIDPNTLEETIIFTR